MEQRRPLRRQRDDHHFALLLMLAVTAALFFWGRGLPQGSFRLPLRNLHSLENQLATQVLASRGYRVVPASQRRPSSTAMPADIGLGVTSAVDTQDQVKEVATDLGLAKSIQDSKDFGEPRSRIRNQSVASILIITEKKYEPNANFLSITIAPRKSGYASR